MSTTYVDGAVRHDEMLASSVNIGDVTYGRMKILRVTEDTTVAVGSGADPVVETTANLAPANSVILGGTVEIVTAPGGGATELDVGITGGGNLDGIVDGMAVTAGTSAHIGHGGDGNDTYPSANTSAATLTLTTDADVTGTAMVVRTTVWYYTFVAPA